MGDTVNLNLHYDESPSFCMIEYCILKTSYISYKGRLKSSLADQDNMLECDLMEFIF